MRIVRRFLLVIVVAAIPGDARAQAHDHRSPYVGLEDREIKALSAEEIQGLLDGQGMSLALPAELNGLPGPRHVLDMRAELSLSDEQDEQVREVFEAMSQAARHLGAKIIQLEAELDAGFADRTITEESLDTLLASLGGERAKLRAVHLKAHLSLIPVLTDEQRASYNRLRGYEG
jgi:Spy/CpxP family protein refolding chaperone